MYGARFEILFGILILSDMNVLGWRIKVVLIHNLGIYKILSEIYLQKDLLNSTTLLLQLFETNSEFGDNSYFFSPCAPIPL